MSGDDWKSAYELYEEEQMWNIRHDLKMEELLKSACSLLTEEQLATNTDLHGWWHNHVVVPRAREKKRQLALEEHERRRAIALAKLTEEDKLALKVS